MTARLLLALAFAGLAVSMTVAQTRISPETEDPLPGALFHTNRAKPAPRADALRRLEEELSRTFKPLAPKTSLEGFSAPVTPPAQRTITVNPAAAEAMERKRNWALLSPEEVAGLEETARLFDPLDKPSDISPASAKTKVLEEAYLNYGKNNKPNANPGKVPGMEYNPFAEQDRSKPSASSGSGLREAETEAALPEALRNSRQALDEMSRADSENNVFGRSTFRDFFGSNSEREDKSFVRERDRGTLEEYKRMLNPSAPASTPGAIQSLMTPSTGARPAATPGSVIGSYQPGSLGAQMQTLNPASAPRGPVDPSARALNSWNPLYVTPTMSLPPRPAPPKPNFEAPRRQF